MTGNSALSTLIAQAKGAVLRRGDDQFEAELNGFQAAVRHRPAVVVAAQVAEDVRAAVEFAVAQRLPVAVQAAGHGVTVAPEDSVLINTSRMDGVTIDPQARTASLEAGVIWEKVVEQSQPYGLAPLSGSAPHVGAVSYTLGGGTALLARRYGYAADHVRSIDVVTADATLRHVAPDSDPDLFWALRGARDNFGIVTGLEIDLLPVSEVFGGGLTFDAELAGPAFELFRTWSAGLPDELTASIGMVGYPPLPQLPEPLRGRHIVHLRFAYTGSAEDGEQLIAPLRELGPVLIDDVRTRSYAEAGGIYRDPTFSHGYYGNSVLLSDLDRQALREVVALAGPEAAVPSVVDLRQLGGALAATPAVPSAVAHRDAKYLLRIISSVTGDAPPSVIKAAHQRIYDAVAPWTLGRSLNFIYGQSEPDEFVADVYPPEQYRRLAQLKAVYDPGNLFRANHNIVPSRP